MKQDTCLASVSTPPPRSAFRVPPLSALSQASPLHVHVAASHRYPPRERARLGNAVLGRQARETRVLGGTAYAAGAPHPPQARAHCRVPLPAGRVKCTVVWQELH